MNSDFSDAMEDRLYLEPGTGQPRFSVALWNTRVVPLARRLARLAAVSSVEAGYRFDGRPVYMFNVWTSRERSSGLKFAITPLAGAAVELRGFDLAAHKSLTGNSWDSVLQHAHAHRRPAYMLAHVR